MATCKTPGTESAKPDEWGELCGYLYADAGARTDARARRKEQEHLSPHPVHTTERRARDPDGYSRQ